MDAGRRIELIASLGASACVLSGLVMRLTVWPRPPCFEYKVPGDDALISGTLAYECNTWLPSTTWDGYLQSGLLFIVLAMTAAALGIACGAIMHVRGRAAGCVALWLSTAMLVLLTLNFGWWDLDVTRVAACLLALLASVLALNDVQRPRVNMH